jgi:curli biogenesis system outer membrane secretion channel CsgG
MHTLPKFALVTAAVISLTACPATAPRVGDDSARTAATGSAGGATTSNASSQLEKCDSPYGTIAVVEDQGAQWYGLLRSRYQLGSTVPVLRLLMQQSNCFIVVERGRAMGNMMQERQLQQSGELRSGSNFGAGQMVSADYSVNPEVLFSERNTSGLRGAAAAVGGGLLGAVAGGFRTNEAATMLTLVDNRSGVQVGVAEGASKNTDFSFGGLAIGGGAAGGLGGYTSTPQGKVVSAAFMDSYNQLVRAMRGYQAQSMGDRGLGTGGRLSVDGASQPGQVQPAAHTTGGGVMSPIDAQVRLNQLGFPVGTPDGRFGPRTREALRGFQAQRGIRVTGELDSATQAELRK